MTNVIKLPQLSWYDTGELEVPLPDDWDVKVCNMGGYDRPALSDDRIKAAITNPIGAPRIRELARGKNEVVIIFDDIHRVTRVAKIVPYIIEELEAAGIPDNRIRFIGANGNHGAMSRIDLAKKLGEAALARFPVYNHNTFENCTYVGTTSRGTKVMINAEVMKCDLKIAVGAITAHMITLFSGGGKIILPGVASIDTTQANHGLRLTDRKNYETNEVRLDMDEAAELAGLDVLIEGIVNLWGETVSLFAGAPVPVHAAGVMEAITHYQTPRANSDIVIANSYAKVTEAVTAFLMTAGSVKEGGDFVLIANSPYGQVAHYLDGHWGTTTGGRKAGLSLPLPPNINHLIVYTEYPDIAGMGFFEKSDRVLQLSNWDDITRILREFHGDKATVSVYPNADIQYLV
ncbi:lactate racemase domain-containing protein [Chloroflexota bacterium]